MTAAKYVVSLTAQTDIGKRSHANCTADNLPTFCQIDLVCQLNVTGFFFFIIFLYFCHHLPDSWYYSTISIHLFEMYFLEACLPFLYCHCLTVLSFLSVYCSLLLLVQTYKRTSARTNSPPPSLGSTPGLQRGEAPGKGRRGDMMECWGRRRRTGFAAAFLKLCVSCLCDVMKRSRTIRVGDKGSEGGCRR